MDSVKDVDELGGTVSKGKPHTPVYGLCTVN